MTRFFHSKENTYGSALAGDSIQRKFSWFTSQIYVVTCEFESNRYKRMIKSSTRIFKVIPQK